MTNNALPEQPDMQKVLAQVIDRTDHPTQEADDKMEGKEPEEIFKKDIEAQTEKLKTIDKTDHAILIAAVTKTAAKFGLKNEVIMSWIYAKEIHESTTKIQNLAKKLGEKEFSFNAILGRKSRHNNTVEAHEVTKELQKILSCLGYSVEATGTYGKKAELTGAATKILQGVLKAELQSNLTPSDIPEALVSDSLLGENTLKKTGDLVEKGEQMKKTRAAEAQKEFIHLSVRHLAALDRFKELYGETTTAASANLDLNVLQRYRGQPINMLNSNGTMRQERYSPENILDPKNESYKSNYGAFNEILATEVQILEQAVADKEKEREVTKQFDEISLGAKISARLEKALAIYAAFADSSGKTKADELLAPFAQEALASIPADIVGPEKVHTITDIWQKLPESSFTRQKAEEKIWDLLKPELTSGRLHPAEAKKLFPEEAKIVQSYLDDYLKVRQGEDGTFQEYLLKLLEKIDTKLPASDQLHSAFDIYERGNIQPEGQAATKIFFDTPKLGELLKQAFKEIRTDGGKDKNALGKFEALKELFDRTPDGTKLKAAFLDMYNGKGSIDRELYGRFGLLGGVLEEASAATRLDRLEEVKQLVPQGTKTMEIIDQHIAELMPEKKPKFLDAEEKKEAPKKIKGPELFSPEPKPNIFRRFIQRIFGEKSIKNNIGRPQQEESIAFPTMPLKAPGTGAPGEVRSQTQLPAPVPLPHETIEAKGIEKPFILQNLRLREDGERVILSYDQKKDYVPEIRQAADGRQTLIFRNSTSTLATISGIGVVNNLEIHKYQEKGTPITEVIFNSPYPLSLKILPKGEVAIGKDQSAMDWQTYRNAEGRTSHK